MHAVLVPDTATELSWSTTASSCAIHVTRAPPAGCKPALHLCGVLWLDHATARSFGPPLERLDRRRDTGHANAFPDASVEDRCASCWGRAPPPS